MSKEIKIMVEEIFQTEDNEERLKKLENLVLDIIKRGEMSRYEN